MIPSELDLVLSELESMLLLPTAARLRGLEALLQRVVAAVKAQKAAFEPQRGQVQRVTRLFHRAAHLQFGMAALLLVPENGYTSEGGAAGPVQAQTTRWEG